jgi:hypothetical protein
MIDSIILSLALQQHPVFTAPANTTAAITVPDAHQAHLAYLARLRHLAHVAHLAHLARLRMLAGQHAAGPPHVVTASYTRAGVFSFAGLERLWESAGGPAWAAPAAASIAECESGGNPVAYNPSGATGVWQILGSVVPGDLTNPYVNAANAVSKFRTSGNTFAQWVCQA